MIPSEQEATSISRLGDVAVYLPKIMKGESMQSGWSGLLDLNLFGRPLGDDTAGDLFEAFSSIGVAKRLRTIELCSCKIGDNGVAAICEVSARFSISFS